MRLVTFNILHGRSPADGQVVPDRLAEAVRSLHPDVLALQEVDQAQARSGGVDLTALAAEAMGARDYRFVAAVAGTPGQVWTAATGAEQPADAAYGIALLSRLPVTSWTVARLRPLPVAVPLKVASRRRPVLVRDEPRVAVVAQLQAPEGLWSVATTHLSFVPGWGGAQLRRVAALLRSMPGPRVLLGDLNLGVAQARRITGWHGLARGATWPADQPRAQLDHVLADRPLPVRASRVEQLPLSDHRALVVDLEPGSGGPPPQAAVGSGS